MRVEDSVLKKLKWEKCPDYEKPYLESANSVLHAYIIVGGGEKYVVNYYYLSGGYTKKAYGFNSVQDAKDWCFIHYNIKMKPYLK